MGRPSKYTTELGDDICELIATTEMSLHKIAKKFNVSPSSIFKWLSENSEFSDKYARAKEMQAELFASQIIDIADERSNDSDPENGNVYVQRDRLRVDSRKWIVSKLLPKKYGDKVSVDNNISITKLPDWLKDRPDGSTA